MKKEKDNGQKNSLIQKALLDISGRKKAPMYGFIILFVLYIFTTIVVSSTAGSDAVVKFMGSEVALYTFAGVFSAVANICVVFMAVYYGKLGFYTSLTVILLQLPIILMGIIVQHNISSLPGVVTDFLTIFAIIIIYSNNVRMEKYRAKISEQAVTDLLTGLPNRFACTELITDYIKRGEKFVLVSIDINHFKSINDTMGHNAGNSALIEISDRWRRIADSGSSGTVDFLGRHGGDEFTLVISCYKNDADVRRSIEFYAAALDRSVTVDECDLFMTASFGYAEFPNDAADADTLVLYADAAMREVKRNKNSEHIMRFTRDILHIEHTLEIEQKIRTALDNNTFFFHLQPQFDLSHKLRGFEALARMKDADGNIISPGEFIPVAEKVGLIDKVDLSVFRNSAMFFGELLKKTGSNITLSVNVSVRHLMKNGFINEIRKIVETCSVPPEQIEIEITESIMIDSAEKALQCINELKGMGMKIAIDDFGTGYSSLSYLNRFPANLLKIDKSFIDKMNSGESSKKYVAAIISIGHIMNFEVISEGVEEEEQLETLREIGCDYIQGFIWGRPMMPEDAEKLAINA